MDNNSSRPSLKAFYGIFMIFLELTVIQCAPQNIKSSVFGEVFQEGPRGLLCEELKNHGYEGFECTTRGRCGEDGYVDVSAIEGDLTVWRDDYDEYGETHSLDLSNYDCPNVRSENIDDYYSYEDEEDNEMVCCRDASFYGKGKILFYVIISILFQT